MPAPRFLATRLMTRSRWMPSVGWMSEAVKTAPVGAGADERGRRALPVDEAHPDLAGVDLAAVSEAVNADLAAQGVSFGGESKPFRVDPVPRVIEADEWARLARGLAQRARALGAFVADVYYERAIVRAGVMPAAAIESAHHFEPWMLGVPFSTAGFVAGVDVVRGADGELRVLEDNARTPSGMAYATAARETLDRHLPVDPPADRLGLDRLFELLARTLREADPTGNGDPMAVLLSDGPANSAWYEHRQLAERLRIPVVLPSDLHKRGGRLYASIADGRAREVQVVYRRTDIDRLTDEHGHATWVADALLEPSRQGNLAVVNPLGAGLADDKLAHAYVEEMISFYLGEEPLVRSVPTHDLSDPDELERTLGRLDELVIKPRAGHGGAGVVVCAHATDEDRADVEAAIRAHPDGYVAQETVALSRHATVVDGDGTLEPRHVDLRPFVFGAGANAETAPGGLTRVAFAAGSLMVNSSQDGGGKDTWALR